VIFQLLDAWTKGGGMGVGGIFNFGVTSFNRHKKQPCTYCEVQIRPVPYPSFIVFGSVIFYGKKENLTANFIASDSVVEPEPELEPEP
jgi:hypothetical protein